MKENTELEHLIKGYSQQIDFSGVVYVKQEDRVLIDDAFGYANRAEGLSNNVHTRFGIASGCKLFTAIGLCQLVETGVIAFDTPLVDGLAIDFPYFDKDVTIHHLLTHTSGIPDYFDEEVMTDYEDLWKDRPVYEMNSLTDFLPLFQHHEMKYSPGERFHYNNAGYILLGLIIEQQSGKSFTDYVEEEIFQKAGITDSGYFSLDQLPQNTAMGYIDNEEDGTWRTNIYSIPAKGGADGGAFITAPDMLTLWEALFNHQLLTKEMTCTLLRPHVHVNGEINYGYGIWMNQNNDHIYKYHVMGYDPGVNFRASYYPDHHLKVAVPSNQESGSFELTKIIEEHVLKS
ncbi:penicillin-binding protein [Halobacillus andaensis]|uniref:Penicillin-binding protein n=1 Tax=Halobacillus andaensis TaxID=1176239 RepID=A0A917B3R9_HALAA|nr:serine hydrolase [Halobacillus andaensis]MBP2004887.1 CubicO group peptidase (beta-lactamase class C family) [Halobacillus andaensis]GGF18103.1 penicillin-binding protein [Halobacillus andaensis]